MARSETAFLSAEEAIQQIPSRACMAVGGFIGAGHPEFLTAALERHFLKEDSPRELTLYYCAGQGDREGRGLNHLAHAGLIKRVIGGHWNLAPGLGRLALADQIEAYNFPQGVLCCLLREIAAGRPGFITRVGLNTFVDPIHGGGRLNPSTTDFLVERLELDGEIYLRYKTVPLNVGLIRATAADSRGNLTMEREGLIGEVLPMAQAVKNNGGLVIAQVEERVGFISDPKAVRVPGMLVDIVVVSDPQHHPQTFGEPFNPAFVSGSRQELELDPIPESDRKAIGRRALKEIRKGDIVNLGIGLPETVASVAAETGRLQDFTLTVESGPIGGIPASGLNFGCSHYPEAIIDQPAQFDFYDGGGLDIALLGAIEVDAEGNVNVAGFGDRFAGIGGFINIAQSAKRLVFCCSFLAKGKPKFIPKVSYICFHGPTALKQGQEVLYITERGVFELTPEGIRLIECSPGLDLQTDILDQMAFRPQIADDLQLENP